MTAARVLLSRYTGVSRIELIQKVLALQTDKDAIYTERVEWERKWKGQAVELRDAQEQLRDWERIAIGARNKAHEDVVEAYKDALRIVASKGQD